MESHVKCVFCIFLSPGKPLLTFPPSHQCRLAQDGCPMEGYRPEKLYAELIRLLEKQVEARETAVFVGLTDVELSEYDKRRERIRELLAELDNLRAAA